MPPLFPSFANTQECPSLVTLFSPFFHPCVPLLLPKAVPLWSPFCHPCVPLLLPKRVTLWSPFYHPCVPLLISRVFLSLITLLSPFFHPRVSLLLLWRVSLFGHPFATLFSPMCPFFFFLLPRVFSSLVTLSSLFCHHLPPFVSLFCYPWICLFVIIFSQFSYLCVFLLSPFLPYFATLWTTLVTLLPPSCPSFVTLCHNCVTNVLLPLHPSFATTLVAFFLSPFCHLFTHLYPLFLLKHFSLRILEFWAAPISIFVNFK